MTAQKKTQESDFLGMSIKKEFSLGDLIQIVLLIIAVSGAYWQLSERINLLEEHLKFHRDNHEIHTTWKEKDYRYYPRQEADQIHDRFREIRDLKYAEISARLFDISTTVKSLEKDFNDFLKKQATKTQR